MFKLTSNPTFKRDVTISVPVDGGFREETFEATFRVLPISQFKEFDVGTLEGQETFLRKVIAGLAGITDDAGKPVPYNDKLRDEMIDFSFIRSPLMKAYEQGIMGAREKN